HLGEAAELGMVVIAPIRIAVGEPVVAHAVLIGVGWGLLIGVADLSTAAIEAGVGQPVVVELGRGRRERRTILARRGDLGDHLHTPGPVVGMDVVVVVAIVGLTVSSLRGTVERVVAIISDLSGLRIYDGGGAVRIVVGA